MSKPRVTTKHRLYAALWRVGEAISKGAVWVYRVCTPPLVSVYGWVVRRYLLRPVEWRHCAWNPAMAAENQMKRVLARELKLNMELIVQAQLSQLMRLRAQHDRDAARMRYHAAYNRDQIRAYYDKASKRNEGS
jgi:hypothetical protein